MNNRRRQLLSFALCAAFFGCPALAAEQPEPIQISGAYLVQPPPETTVMAGYLTLVADPADRLRGGASVIAKRVEVHTHENVDGVMRMRKLEALDLPAAKSVELAPGGLHLMLFDLDHRPAVGEKISVALDFEQAGMLSVDFEVRDGRESAANDPHAGHH